METCNKNGGKDVGKDAGKTAPKNGTSPICCVTDCMMEKFGMSKNGAFDAELAKKSIAASVKDKAWTPAVSLNYFCR